MQGSFWDSFGIWKSILVKQIRWYHFPNGFFIQAFPFSIHHLRWQKCHCARLYACLSLVWFLKPLMTEEAIRKDGRHGTCPMVHLTSVWKWATSTHAMVKQWPFIPCPPFSVHPSQAERKKKFNKRWKLICSEWTGTGRRRNRSWEKEMQSCVDLGFFFTFSILFKWINEVRLVIYLWDALVGERDIVILESIWLDISLISIGSVINI